MIAFTGEFIAAFVAIFIYEL